MSGSDEWRVGRITYGLVQSAPVQPALHMHGPALSVSHRPRRSPPHSREAHSRRPAVELCAIEQSLPLNPGSHTHRTSFRCVTSQCPCSEHAVGVPGHVLRAQSRPFQPTSHMHSPSTHRPFGAEHPLGHTSVAQLTPRQPGEQAHLPWMQWPRPGAWQLAGHVVFAQNGGANPTWHSHAHLLVTRSHMQWPLP